MENFHTQLMSFTPLSHRAEGGRAAYVHLHRGETEAQRGYMTCPKPLRKKDLQPWVLLFLH